MDKQVFMDFELRFNLRQKKIEKPTLVYAVFMWERKQYKVSTSVKVYPSQWDTKTHTAKISNLQSKLDNRNNEIANLRIVEIIKKVKDNIPHLSEKLDFINFANEIKCIIKPLTKCKNMKKNNISMIAILNQMAEKYKGDNQRQYLGCVSRFNKFIETSEIEDVIYNLNGDLLNKYQAFLVKEGKQYKTISGYLKNLKTLINKANGLPMFLESKIDVSSFKMIEDKRSGEQKKSKQVALTEEQLKTICNLSGLTSKEEEVRDLFVCQCLLGQRISDMPKIFKGDYDVHIVENNIEIISFNVQKTKEIAHLYLFPIAKQIIEKYRTKKLEYFDLFNVNDKYLYRFEEKFNKALRDLGLKAGFTDKVSYTIQVGEELKKESAFQYELLHSHTARHTFITLMCRYGVKKEDVRIATAHTDDKMIDEVYNHQSINDIGTRLINSIQNISNSSFFVVPERKGGSKQLNDLFAYDLFQSIISYGESNNDIFHYKPTLKAIEVIKDISKLNCYANEIDKEKVIDLEQIIFELSYYYRDVQLYSAYKFKEKYFGISESVPSHDEVEAMFIMEDIERPKKQIQADIEAWENR